MKVVSNLASFVKHPVGNCFVGEQFMLWSVSSVCVGTIAWGRLSETSTEQLLTGWEFEERLSTPYDSVIDLGGLIAIDSAVFERVAKYMETKLPKLAERVKKQALVRPKGIHGAVVAGFYPVLKPGYTWQDFATRTEAFRWCWPDQPLIEEVVTKTLEQTQTQGNLLIRLRSLLPDHLRTCSLAEIARLLGRSTRSLQRELHGLNTSFRDEVHNARIYAAQQLLVNSDMKVETIAKRIGIESVSAFVTLFREKTGQTPTEFRVQREKPL